MDETSEFPLSKVIWSMKGGWDHLLAPISHTTCGVETDGASICQTGKLRLRAGK